MSSPLYLRPLALLAGLALVASTTVAQTTHVVQVNALSFNPANVTIDVGDTVQWDWVTGIHNVESGVNGVPDGHFSSGAPVGPPQSFRVTFDQAFLDANPAGGNLYDYYCIVHLGFGMTGTVKVDEPASGSSRNGGSNPASLALVNPPQLGGTFVATQDLSTTGHALAGLVGFASPLNLPLPGGQTLLVNVLDPGGELLGQGLLGGPLATWMLAVPNDAALCGLEVSVQGIHVGAVQPFALSNALDLVLGV